MKTQAIFKIYPNAVRVDADFTTYDVNGKKIDIDDALVKAKVIELEAEKAMKDAEDSMIRAIDKFIQAEVNRLNIAKGVKFKDVYSCQLYGSTDGYELQAECKALWDWSSTVVWQSMRAWQQTLTGVPTYEEFVTELTKHAFEADY